MDSVQDNYKIFNEKKARKRVTACHLGADVPISEVLACINFLGQATGQTGRITYDVAALYYAGASRSEISKITGLKSINSLQESINRVGIKVRQVFPYWRDPIEGKLIQAVDTRVSNSIHRMGYQQLCTAVHDCRTGKLQDCYTGHPVESFKGVRGIGPKSADSICEVCRQYFGQCTNTRDSQCSSSQSKQSDTHCEYQLRKSMSRISSLSDQVMHVRNAKKIITSLYVIELPTGGYMVTQGETTDKWYCAKLFVGDDGHSQAELEAQECGGSVKCYDCIPHTV